MIQQNGEAFRQAIEATTIQELPTVIDQRIMNRLKDTLRRTGMVLLGEIHGVQENPLIIYTLIKQLGCRGLALEWRGSLKSVVQTFIETGQLAYDAIEDNQDGRITAGHFALLRKLHTEGLLDQLILFDLDFQQWLVDTHPRNFWNKRDTMMASTILVEKSVNIPLLVVSGNAHTRLSFRDKLLMAFQMHNFPKPMGDHIRTRLPATPSIIIKYLSGHYHNMSLKTIQASRTRSTQARLYRHWPNRYIYELPEAHAAIVP